MTNSITLPVVGNAEQSIMKIDRLLQCGILVSTIQIPKRRKERRKMVSAQTAYIIKPTLLWRIAPVLKDMTTNLGILIRS